MIDPTINNDEGILIPFSGDKPSSGYLNYSNNTLTSGCLVFGDYAVTFDGNTTSTAKGTCSSNPGTSESESGSGQSGENYTYFGYGSSIENPIGYDFNYENYQEPENNNECPSGYAYYEGDEEYNSEGCYYIYEGYCDKGEYNYETDKCDYEGFMDMPTISNDWTFYLRNDETKTEVCGVFGSGQAGTVCMTSPYYNNDYDNKYYNDDFKGIHGEYNDITTAEELSEIGLKGYALDKAVEMLNKGASSCYVYDYSVECYMPSGGYCSIESTSSTVSCHGNSFGICYIQGNGNHNCEDY